MDGRMATSVLYLDNVTVSFDGFSAMNELSLVLEGGEIAPSSDRTAPERRR